MGSSSPILMRGGGWRHPLKRVTKGDPMSTPSFSPPGGTWTLGDLTVTRFGYGAMQLAGPWVMGPPADRDGALAVLRAAVDLGVTHIDTSDAYGPRVTNALIREALHPYPESLHIATKVGATRDEQGGWPTARRPEDLRRQDGRFVAACSAEGVTREGIVEAAKEDYRALLWGRASSGGQAVEQDLGA
jgi:pyridoxine 4-dehydrogenase